MVSVYSDADYLAAYKQKQKIWWVFVWITLTYAVFCIAWLCYHISLPYGDSMLPLPKWCVFIASALYIAFIFPYLSIKYGRVRRYFKMLTYVSIGLKNEETNHFYCFDESFLQKDHVDVVSCVFETWNKKKCEWMEREAYCDPEKPLPPFESGDLVRYVVQSNFVVQYEILQKKALEFEEVDEFEENDPETVENQEEKQEENQ